MHVCDARCCMCAMDLFPIFLCDEFVSKMCLRDRFVTTMFLCAEFMTAMILCNEFEYVDFSYDGDRSKSWQNHVTNQISGAK